MKTKRRDFLKLGLFQAIAFGLTQKNYANPRPVQRREGPSILQGATDDTKTQFNILYDNIELEIFVTNSNGQKWLPDEARSTSFPNHPKMITQVFFSKLVPNETYLLNLFDIKKQQVLDVREFQTLDLSKPSLRFAICSCMKDTEHNPDIWINMIQNKPDILFFVGDSVYADHQAPKSGVNPTHMWKRFCEARTTLEVYYSKKLVPILATWDDHDFGANDANSRNFPYVKESQANFLSFFAQEQSHCDILTKGPGVSSALNFRNHLFVLLDDRSYRDTRGSQDRYAHWGQEQETWMLNLLRQNPGRASWLMNGSQFFPAVPWKESVSGDHPVQFSGLLQELKTIPSKVVFVSGDVHYSEISRIEPESLGYETFELTSSSIHSKNIPGTPDIVPNSRRVIGTGKRNYILVDAETSGGEIIFQATCHGANNEVKFQMNLKV